MNRNSDEKAGKFVEQTLTLKEQEKIESVFRIFMDKVNEAEISVQEQGYFTEEEVEVEVAKIYIFLESCLMCKVVVNITY